MTWDTELKLEPYWWEAGPRPMPPPAPLPQRVEVAIVGSGYTGLSAALTLARAGRNVLVMDREAAGWGASSRNQGHVGASFKRSFQGLRQAYGSERAERIHREGQAAIEHTKALIESELIDCHLSKSGRFIAAWNAAHFEALAQETEQRVARTDLDAQIVDAAHVHEHVGSERFCGGVYLPREASLHGARFHLGLLEVAKRAGVAVHAHTDVQTIERDQTGHRLHTSRGRLHADQVLIATNGYTGALLPALRRRIVPVNSFGIATELLAPEIIAQLMPGGRPCINTLKLSHGFRVAPAENRIIFGTRPTRAHGDLRAAAAHLRRELCTVFPQLQAKAITHAWTGYVGFPFDFLPHAGEHEGIHYAMGYCGYGVSLAPYLGNKIALRMLGDADGSTVFAELPFETRPLYFGSPWFIPPMMLYYRWLDRRAS